MTKSLFLVRGNDVDCENQDLFVVADDHDEAVTLWNGWCVENEYPRDDGDDDCDPDKTFDPENVRVIVRDVVGTEYGGKPSHVVEWPDLAVIY